MMKKRTFGVFAYITCGLFVAACCHNEFTASEQSRSLDSVPLSKFPASQYDPITGKFVDETGYQKHMDIGYPRHMEYHQKVAIDEYNNVVRASKNLRNFLLALKDSKFKREVSKSKMRFELGITTLEI